MELNMGDLESLTKIIAATGLGGMCTILMLRIFMRKMLEETAGSEIIENLRAEVARLATINATLTLRITELHNEVENLRGENTELKSDLKRLTAEVRYLHNAGQDRRGRHGV